MVEVKDKELHRVTTTVLVYKPDFTYLITKRAMHKPVHPGKWSIDWMKPEPMHAIQTVEAPGGTSSEPPLLRIEIKCA